MSRPPGVKAAARPEASPHSNVSPRSTGPSSVDGAPAVSDWCPKQPGGRVGFELGCDVRAPGDSETFDCEAPELAAEDAAFPTESVDFGLLVGGGVGVPAGAGELLIEARYDIGLNDINDFGSPTAREFNNRVLTLLAGYEVPLF